MLRQHVGPGLLQRGGPLLEVLLKVLASGHENVHQAVATPPGGVPLVAAFDGRFGTAWTRQWQAGTGRPGTPTALLTAARSTLRGDQRAELIERDGGDPHAVRLRVYAAEVQDLGATRAAAQEHLPDGLLLTVDVLTGSTVEHMRTQHGPTVAAYLAQFPTVADARDHLPE